MVYQSICKVCVKSGSDQGRYIGGTGRSLYEWRRENLEDAHKKKETSNIFKHWAVSHSTMLSQPEFTFKVLKTHKSPLDRQIHEAVKIATHGILTARCEFRQNMVNENSIEPNH